MPESSRESRLSDVNEMAAGSKAIDSYVSGVVSGLAWTATCLV
jgi:hypothetical protein